MFIYCIFINILFVQHFVPIHLVEVQLYLVYVVLTQGCFQTETHLKRKQSTVGVFEYFL